MVFICLRELKERTLCKNLAKFWQFFGNDYSLCVWLDHDVAVDEDGADDGEGEERVGEDVDGDPPEWVKINFLFIYFYKKIVYSVVWNDLSIGKVQALW